METQSPGAGPSRCACVHDIDDSASILTDSSAPYDRGSGATSRSLLLEVDVPFASGPWSSSIQVDLVPPPPVLLPDSLPPPVNQANPVASFKFGPKEGTWCGCTLDHDEGRNLVVCIDGTANQFGFQNTNVVELYSRLDKHKRQLTYYNSGIGTYVKDSNWLGLMKQALVHGWDMAVAWNLKKIILDAYKWLSENYQAGDCIFLFGFSRGAYQVRIIAGMIQIVGLLHKGNNEQIAFAYELYLANIHRDWKNRSWLHKIFSSEKKDEDAAKKVKELSDQFKLTLSHKNATVHFIGVWDTVSSVGITRGPSFPETNGMKGVCGVRHVLSLDEERDKFQPEYVNGGAGPDEYPPSEERNRVKEVWFVGSHSDIGGGNSDNIKLDHFGPSLRWMIYEAQQYGLKVELSLKGWGSPEHKPSMTWVWRILEVYPFRRLTYKDADSTERWPPHLGRGRLIQKTQRIHESVAAYMKERTDYTPAACLPGGVSYEIPWSNWEEVRKAAGTGWPFEQDADFDSPVIEILTKLRDASKNEGGIRREDLVPFRDLMSFRGGSQSIIDAASKGSPWLLFDTLRHTVSRLQLTHDADMFDAISAIAEGLAVFPAAPDTATRYTKDTLEYWLEHAKVEHRQRILEVFIKESLSDPIRGHLEEVSCVAYSPDGTYIASASVDNTIRLWDAKRGEPFGEPLCGHTKYVQSIAFSPDSEHIVSGSWDNNIRLWDVKTQQPIGQPFAGHDSVLNAIALFPYGTRIVSGSDDKTLRIWDTETQSAVGEPLRGHTHHVLSVAVSPDGTRIASGSADTTVRIWNAETREVVHVLEVHSSSNWVWSVVFSPDGKRVVSGSTGETIRVWDVETGKMVLGPLSGHEGFKFVYSVAVSPDGKYIASGSGDKTVRLWDAVTGKAVGEPLRGHTDEVSSVAFSPDSRRVVSGSEDRTLRIWEIEDCLNRVDTVNSP